MYPAARNGVFNRASKNNAAIWPEGTVNLNLDERVRREREREMLALISSQPLVIRESDSGWREEEGEKRVRNTGPVLQRRRRMDDGMETHRKSERRFYVIVNTRQNFKTC